MPGVIVEIAIAAMEGELLVARADGGVARLFETTQQMMALIKG